jgi:hypothetical protein
MFKKIIIIALAVLSFGAKAECSKADIAKLVAGGVVVTGVVAGVITVGVAASTTVMVAGSPTVLAYVLSGAASTQFISTFAGMTMAVGTVFVGVPVALLVGTHISNGCMKSLKSI